MHSLILCDEQMVPLTRMITWADTRAVEQAEKIEEHSTRSKHLPTNRYAASSNDAIRKKSNGYQETQPELIRTLPRIISGSKNISFIVYLASS